MGGPHHLGLLSFQKPLALLALRTGRGSRVWPVVRLRPPPRSTLWLSCLLGSPWGARDHALPPCSLATSFRAQSISLLNSGGFPASLLRPLQLLSPSAMLGSKLSAQCPVGSESGGRGDRPAKEHVNRK